LKRVISGIVCGQETAIMLKFEDISLLHRYNLRHSLAFQTASKSRLLVVRLQKDLILKPTGKLQVASLQIR
jgi:hypothetical protein